MFELASGTLFLTSLMGAALALYYRDNAQYLKEELADSHFLLSQVQGENHLLWDILKAGEEEKACDTCLTPKPLNQYHSHPTCKGCRQGKDAARYKAKKGVIHDL